MPPKTPAICIVGLGYVGLPLAHAFGKTEWKTYGYDLSEERVEELKKGKDKTGELTEEDLKNTKVKYSNDPSIISNANVIIIAVPTPIGSDKRPDLKALRSASETVAENMNTDSVVIFESTVYPGVTEETCGKILSEKSGNKNFYLGYSPERVNPGDKEHTIEKIVKVVAGQDEETTNFIVGLYGKIVKAGVHRAPNIKVAEMAKAIENAQRDLNIAYINEIAMLCDKIGIETKDVLDAAGTKWNFLKFSPGLVGGHCIGVDPYYLVEKAKSMGMTPKVITAGRSINDSISKYIVDEMILPELNSNNIQLKESNILVLGLTFKEDVPDTRNSKSVDVINQLKAAGCNVFSHDAQTDNNGNLDKESFYDAIVLLVPHKEYLEKSPYDFSRIANRPCIFFDLKSVYEKKDIEDAGMLYLAL
jgi:UDP-N-acetyl-D-glucosamine/UDP-N-acetyl-D-galactosamine dehydrogenase